MYHPYDVEALGDFAARVCIDAEKAGGPPVLGVHPRLLGSTLLLET